MRYIVASLLFVCSLVYAEPYKLKWYGEHIVYEPAEFTLVDRAAEFDFYVVNTSINNDKNPVKRILSLLVYHDTKVMTPIDTPVKRMYTEGTINCDAGIAVLLVEFWVDSGDNLVFAYNQAVSETIVELLTPNTTRNRLYKKVCNK
jgi:hypothetical protein